MTDENDLGPLLQEKIGEAIESAVQQHERGFVTKWVCARRVRRP